jgi:membrane fusion protein, heavy metal efflux system
MFAKATFRAQTSEVRTLVPSTAIVHIHDRDYVYLPEGHKFRRIEVVGGDTLADNRQEITSGLKPGQQVISNALVLEHTIEQ